MWIHQAAETDNEWQIRGHGAFEINRGVLGIRPTDQSCHHEGWIHLSHAKLGWSTITVLVTLSAASKTSGRAKRQSIRPYVTIHSAPEKCRQVRCVWVVSGAAGSRGDGADARDVQDPGSRT